MADSQEVRDASDEAEKFMKQADVEVITSKDIFDKLLALARKINLDVLSVEAVAGVWPVFNIDFSALAGAPQGRKSICMCFRCQRLGT